MELTPSGIVEYMGKYDYYMEKKSQVESGKKYLESMRPVSYTHLDVYKRQREMRAQSLSSREAEHTPEPPEA